MHGHAPMGPFIMREFGGACMVFAGPRRVGRGDAAALPSARRPARGARRPASGILGGVPGALLVRAQRSERISDSSEESTPRRATLHPPCSMLGKTSLN